MSIPWFTPTHLSATEPGMFTLKTSITFAASHKLWNENWSQSKNFEVYGKCSNPNGHGHNYTVAVKVKGDVNPNTGMVINLDDIKRVLKSQVYERVDHKNLNLDIDFLKGKVPTAEILAFEFWKLLVPHFCNGVELCAVTVMESEKNVVTYKGED